MCLSQPEICGTHLSVGIAAPAKQGFLHDWQLSKAYANRQFTRGMILIQNYAGNRQKPYKIMTVQIFVTYSKSRLNTNIEEA